MAASYMHGRGDGPDLKKQWYESKGIYIAILAILGALLGFLNIGLLGLLGSLISPIYWFGFRSSRQAKAELDYMSRNGKSSLKRIAMQYLAPVGACVLPMLVAKMLVIPALAVGSVAIILAASKLFRNDDGEKSRTNRAVTEIANGLVGGINIAGLLVAAKVLVG
jgi:hypothetical protein